MDHTVWYIQKYKIDVSYFFLTFVVLYLTLFQYLDLVDIDNCKKYFQILLKNFIHFYLNIISYYYSVFSEIVLI